MRSLIILALLLQDPKTAEKATVTFESSLELETVVRDGKGETTRLLNLTRKEKFTQVRVDAKTLKIDCLSSTLQKTGSDTPIDEKATALAGRSFLASRSESGWSVKDLDGNAPPIEGRNLGAWNDAGQLLPPGGQPKAGDKWVVDGKDLLALVMPSSIREAVGKFECSCESVEGGKANVVFSGQISGKGREETMITLMIKAGRLTYDQGKKRPSFLMLSGSLESITDIVDEVIKAGTGANVNNEKDRRKIGEIASKTRRLDVTVTIE